MIEVVAGGDFTTWAIDMKKNGCNGIVIRGLTDLENDIVDHAGSNFTWNFLSYDSKEVDLGDAFFLRIVSFDKLFIEVGGRLDMGGVGEQLMVFGEEEEIGEEAASEQNEANDEKEFRLASHEKGKDASD